MSSWARALTALLCLAASACATGPMGNQVTEVAENVLTLQRGTMSELRTRRGQGPFVTYEVAPEEMLEVLEQAARMARGAGGRPVSAVFVSKLRREVVAKERTAEQAHDDSYGPPFRSAMLAVVHPVRGRPGASKVEIHAIQRGPFHQGQVDWERSMPGWIEEVLADRAPLAPIP